MLIMLLYVCFTSLIRVFVRVFVNLLKMRVGMIITRVSSLTAEWMDWRILSSIVQ